MDEYKGKAKLLSTNTSLSEEQKRQQFEKLIETKNAKLEKLLTQQQLDKVVPTSERKKPGKAKQ